VLLVETQPGRRLSRPWAGPGLLVVWAQTIRFFQSSPAANGFTMAASQLAIGPVNWVRTLVIAVRDEAANGLVEFLECHSRGQRFMAAGQVSGQFGQQLRIESAENLALPLRSCVCGSRQFRSELPRGLGQLVAHEVRPVVDIEDVRDLAHRPACPALGHLARGCR
jgi:hypothetical protein